MATSALNHHTKPRVCFSFAAYARNVIDDLKTANIPVASGLSNGEILKTETILNFKFPPDLRSFLQTGLPLGPDFTNWRSSSAQQLQILMNLPLLGLLKEVSKARFWVRSWPEKPDNPEEALKLAKKLLSNVPVLVPVFRNCYIPCGPTSGNPVFYINGGEIRVLSFDLTGFFHQVDFRVSDSVVNRRPSLASLLNLPAWAAAEAREVEFWSAAAIVRSTVARGGWWREEMAGKLREGGWREEEVREMMDGGDCLGKEMDGGDYVLDDVAGHVRGLSVRLLSAGWSREDVVDSLGCQVEVCDVEATSWLEFQHTSNCVLEVI